MPSCSSLFLRLTAAACALAACAAARAADPYLAVGLPGAVFGVAQPVGEHFGVRADYATLGSRGLDGDHEGVNYRGDARYSRVGVFADWFPMAGSFRISAGATFNDGRVQLVALGDGSPITIGGTTYATTTGDRLDVKIQLPDVTPYLGIGWGHQSAQAPGWRVVVDLGASIGRATVDARASGPLLGQVSQADLDAETRELRDGVGRIRAIPQATVGVSYRF